MSSVCINNKFHVEILMILKDAQQQHGLRHKDYQSYRQYISKKLHRMRKSLNFQQGKGNKVLPRKITRNICSDVRYISLKLFEAERAWAAAMQLKSESNNDHRKIFHMRTRLRKAVNLAKELWDLCKWGKCDLHPNVDECEICAITDAHTYVEAQAYYFNMQGVLCFEKAEWKEAKSFYEKAFKEYSGMAKAVDKDHQSIYESKTEELSPLVRYCANNAGESSGGDDITAMDAAGSDLDQFNDLIKQIYKNQVAIVTEVHWLGMTIPVKQESVKLAILALKDTNIELLKSGITNDAKMKIYDSLLKTITDALMVVRDEVKGAGSNNTTQINNQSIDTLTRTQLLFVYLHYVKLSKTIERNLVIIDANRDSTNVKPQSTARLYDTVVQNLQELAGLPGLNLDSTNTSNRTLIATISKAQQELRSKIAVYTAYRCYYLSQAHLLFKRFIECAALLTRTLRHCEDALDCLDQIPNKKGAGVNYDDEGGVCVDLNNETSQQNLKLIPGADSNYLAKEAIPHLQEIVQADQLICRANRCLEAAAEAAGGDSNNIELLVPSNVDMPLYKRMEDFAIDPNLQQKRQHVPLTTSSNSNSNVNPCRIIQSPPEFTPIPIKPVFFDLAQHHIQFPSLDSRISDLTPASTTGGIKRILKGWLW